MSMFETVGQAAGVLARKPRTYQKLERVKTGYGAVIGSGRFQGGERSGALD